MSPGSAGLGDLLALSERLCAETMDSFTNMLSAAVYRPEGTEEERVFQSLRLELFCEELVRNVKALHSLHAALALARASETQELGL